MFNSLKKMFSRPTKARFESVVVKSNEESPVQASEDEILIKRGNGFLALEQLDTAEECYRKAILINPDSAGNRICLGFVLMEQKRFDEARRAIEQALQLDPTIADGFYMLGTISLENGGVDAAIESFNQALAINPIFERIYVELCDIFTRLGQTENAKNILRSAIAALPHVAGFHYSLGNLLASGNEPSEAILCFTTALSLQPHSAEMHFTLANALHAQGKLDAAVEHFQQAILLKLGYAEAHYNLASVLYVQDKLDAAIESLTQAILIKPDYAEAHSQLGLALQDQGKLDEAVACYRNALSFRSDFVLTHFALAMAFTEQGKLDETVVRYQKTLSLKPNYHEAHTNLGGALLAQGKLNAAIASFRQALLLKPCCYPAHGNLLFALNYHPDLSAEEIFAEYQRWNATHAKPLLKQGGKHTNERNPNRRLRIGYVSPDLCRHAARYFIEPLLAKHDKAQIEVFAYAEVKRGDDVTARFKGYVDHWRSTVGLSDDAMAELVGRDAIDILIDLAGHTVGNRLLVFARKPAPIQVSWLGFGYTTGMDAIDYLLADREFAPPGSEALFTEEPVRLPIFAAYRPAEGMGEVGPLPAENAKHITFGSLSRAIRMNHRVIRAWAAILHRLPAARLLFNSGDMRSTILQVNLREQFAAYGIGSDRLEMGFDSPPWDVLRRIDISLDCFPHNSGTTLYESLYMGVPFVTLAGRPSVGRIGASILTGLGHPEWIAATEEDYIDKAVALASDTVALRALRASLRGKMQASVLMDEPAFARSVEAAYWAMWQRWCRESAHEVNAGIQSAPEP